MKKELNKETLKRLYIKEGKSLVKVAELLLCSPFTVWSRCKEYGIKTREPKRIKGVAKVLRSSYFDNSSSSSTFSYSLRRQDFFNL